MKKSGAVIPTAEYEVEVLYCMMYSILSKLVMVIRILFHTTIMQTTGEKIAKNLSSSDLERSVLLSPGCRFSYAYDF